MNKEPDSMLAHMFKDKGECSPSFSHFASSCIDLINSCPSVLFNGIGNNLYKSKSILVCHTVSFL